MVKPSKQKLSVKELLEQALVPKNEQPYELPRNWCWVKFGCLATDMADGPFGSNLKREHYTEKKEVRIIQLSNIGENGWRDENTKYTTYEHAKTISRSIVKSGEIVIAKMMPAGRAIKVPDEEKAYILSSDAVKFVPKKLINTDYLLYAINSNAFRNQVSLETQGITRARTSIGKMKTYAFPLPPLTEQHRIVSRIQSLCAKLDQAKELAQNALDNFETRKAAILHKAFKGELTTNWREQHGVKMNSWIEYKLNSVCNKITDGTHNSPKNQDVGDFMYVTAKNIKETGISLSNITFISQKDHDDIYSRCNVELGDVLYIKDGATTGIAAINTLDVPFSLLSSVALLKPNSMLIDSKYLVWNLNSPNTKSIMLNNMSGNAITRLTIKKIKEAFITVPSLPEQKELVRIIDSLIDKERKVNELVDVIDKIDLMKKAILARALRGELGTNDYTEESAKELLKEILINSKEDTQEDFKVVKRAESVKIDLGIESELKTNIEREIYVILLNEKQAKINDFLYLSNKHFEITRALYRMEKVNLIEYRNGVYYCKRG